MNSTPMTTEGYIGIRASFAWGRRGEGCLGEGGGGREEGMRGERRETGVGERGEGCR